MALPVVGSIDFADEDDDRDENEGDDSETPAGLEHEHQHHGSLRQAAQPHVPVQADLVRHRRCVRRQPTRDFSCTRTSIVHVTGRDLA